MCLSECLLKIVIISAASTSPRSVLQVPLCKIKCIINLFLNYPLLTLNLCPLECAISSLRMTTLLFLYTSIRSLLWIWCFCKTNCKVCPASHYTLLHYLQSLQCGLTKVLTSCNIALPTFILNAYPNHVCPFYFNVLPFSRSYRLALQDRPSMTYCYLLYLHFQKMHRHSFPN